jgi:hypothetical protein
MSDRFEDSFRAGPGRGTARNMQSFMPEQIWEIGASGWFYYKESYFTLFTVLPLFCFTHASIAFGSMHSQIKNNSNCRYIHCLLLLIN